MKLSKIILWIWQLPQNVIGYFFMRTSKVRTVVSNENDYPVYLSDKVFNAGVCLGDYIILDYKTNIGRTDRKVRYHEYGHHRQSVCLGWLYLVVIGIPSLCGNLIDRFFHKKWDKKKRDDWYYNFAWEKWADKLGGVER